MLAQIGFEHYINGKNIILNLKVNKTLPVLITEAEEINYICAVLFMCQLILQSQCPWLYNS